MNLFILTGAGVSAESGVATFRDANGLWEDHDIMDVATPEGFAKDPALVQRFYDARRAQLGTVAPNAAHEALARLQRAHTGRVTIVTQNVDDLHERAGAEVLHMHGELLRARCTAHAPRPPLDGAAGGRGLPDCGAPMRPDIVWFGEMPMHLDAIDAALADADLFAAVRHLRRGVPGGGLRGRGRAPPASARWRSTSRRRTPHASTRCGSGRPRSRWSPGWTRCWTGTSGERRGRVGRRDGGRPGRRTRRTLPLRPALGRRRGVPHLPRRRMGTARHRG